MLDYDLMSRRPSIFRDLTGMDKDEFDALHGRFAAAEAAARVAATTNKKGQPRQRAAGAGAVPRHDTVGRLLMALFWLRVYPTYEVLGFFFGGLHRRNAQLNVRSVLAVLGSMHGFDFDRPGPGRRRLSSPEQVMSAFPAVRLVVDTKEQRVRRPAGACEVQKPYYSGKKKCHTLTTQLAVGPDGRIESVSDSHPGGATHDATLLLKTKLLDELDHAAGESAMMDKGYVPVRKHLPDRPVVRPGQGGPQPAAHGGAEGREQGHRVMPDRRRAHDRAGQPVHGPAAGVPRPRRAPRDAAQPNGAGRRRAGEPADRGPPAEDLCGGGRRRMTSADPAKPKARPHRYHATTLLPHASRPADGWQRRKRDFAGRPATW